MLGWEGRIWDNKSIMVIKAALPFLDIPVGETIDLEGLLRAIRCFCQEREQQLIDMLLNMFMMKRVFSMMNVMSEMNASQESSGGMEHMLDLLKSQMPQEQQEMFEMMSMMMSAAGGFTKETEQEDDSTEESEQAFPDIWQNIVANSEKGIFDDESE